MRFCCAAFFFSSRAAAAASFSACFAAAAASLAACFSAAAASFAACFSAAAASLAACFSASASSFAFAAAAACSSTRCNRSSYADSRSTSSAYLSRRLLARIAACLVMASSAPNLDCGGRMDAIRTSSGAPPSSRKETRASAVFNSWSAVAVSKAGFFRNDSAAALTPFCSAGV